MNNEEDLINTYCTTVDWREIFSVCPATSFDRSVHTHTSADLRFSAFVRSVKLSLSSSLMSRSAFLICWQEVIELYMVVTGSGRANDWLISLHQSTDTVCLLLYYTSAHGQEVLKTPDESSQRLHRWTPLRHYSIIRQHCKKIAGLLTNKKIVLNYITWARSMQQSTWLTCRNFPLTAEI